MSETARISNDEPRAPLEINLRLQFPPAEHCLKFRCRVQPRKLKTHLAMFHARPAFLDISMKRHAVNFWMLSAPKLKSTIPRD
jgi:hypothetical protein